MNLRLLLFLVGFFVGCLAAFDIEKAELTVNVVGTEVTILLPENPDVKTVFFSTETEDECSAGYTFLHSVNSSKSMGYKQELNKKLNENDMLRVLGVFETKDQVITKSYDFKINANGNGVEQNMPKPTEPNTCNPITPIRSTLGKNRDGKCVMAEGSPKENGLCTGDLIFEENFKDNDKYFTNWEHEVFSRANSKHFEFAVFLKNDINSVIKDGQLHITATKQDSKHFFHLKDCTSTSMKNKYPCGPYTIAFNRAIPPVKSAIIRTKQGISLKYGRYEIRAKMPIGDWLFPYIMLQATDDEFHSDPSRHIRIASVRGNRNLKDTSLSHMGGNILTGSAFVKKRSTAFLHEDKKTVSHKTPGRHFGEDFHNYTMIFHSNRIIFKVDGTTYGTITNKEVLDQLNIPHSYYLALGLTAGGTHNFPYIHPSYNIKDEFRFTDPNASFTFEEEFENFNGTWTHPKLVIDNVRVYATHPDEV
ncbi:gram-negative bacteria-binding protein 2-like [Drosophila innubila]|uniref:gram-negative bacteria-binding protein 2-like n=1 Tax=Drosophila innubila TaxID=198719 RepID=UPI00148CA3F9|nr:gram-negative bacteria-binding protein 2-like [Drosophila innubila]